MTRPTATVASIGECMVELSQIDFGGGIAHVEFAGDTLNTATYLARLGIAVSYVTNLGEDRFSDRMVRLWEGEGIGTSLVGRTADRLPGIYAIETDANGERSFRYWREASAARTLFSGPGATLDDLADFQLIYLSGITLAILPSEVRHALIERVAGLRNSGRQVVFDNNYRPRLWPDATTARDSFDAMWATTSLALPSYDDEMRLYPGISPTEAAQRISALGPAEVVLKNGAGGPLILSGGKFWQAAFPVAENVVDTSGAGDSFNAGYLAARLGGASPQDAAVHGHRLAVAVIGRHGAVIPRHAMPV